VGKAWPYEQSGEKKEHRHEKAVGSENDSVKADPRLRVGMTEISVGNKGMKVRARSSAALRVVALGAALVCAGATDEEIDVMRAPAG
jgi:hypothetical protein